MCRKGSFSSLSLGALSSGLLWKVVQVELSKYKSSSNLTSTSRHCVVTVRFHVFYFVHHTTLSNAQYLLLDLHSRTPPEETQGC